MNDRDHPLNEVLRQRAEREARDVVERALDEARGEAVRILKDHFVREILAAATREEQPSPEEGDAFYLYGVGRASEVPAASVRGIDGHRPVEAVTEGDLCAFVSRVPLEEFGTGPLHRHFKDEDWVRRVVNEHDSIIRKLADDSAVVPARFCSLYRTTEAVTALLRGHHDRLVDALRTVEGRTEIGVKVYFRRGAIQSRLVGSGSPSEVDASAGPGTAYMLRKKDEAALEEAAAAALGEWADEVHRELSLHSDDVASLGPQDKSLSGNPDDLALNAAYLVAREGVADFRQAAEHLNERLSESDGYLEVTGPWPPYSFVSLDLRDPR